jgi:RNA polymerase sigma-70 factor, ECF subfamily
MNASASEDRYNMKEGRTTAWAPETGVAGVAVRAVRLGDREAYGRLVELYQRRVFGLALMMVRHRSGAEEVTQDTFLRAFTHLDQYDEHRPFYPWIATIAVRLAQNWLRRHASVRMHEPTGLEPMDEPATTTDLLDELITDERGRHLWRSVAGLPSGERTAVILYYRDEMKVRDIARALGVTSGTVKTLLFRARQRLRRALDDAGAIHQEEST